MYRVAVLLALAHAIHCANYDRDRYGESTTRYSSYPTTPGLYDQYYKPGYSGNYGNNLGSIPEVTRYPNYSPGYSTEPNKYNSYSTPRPNTMYQPGYSTPRYAESYGRGYSSYELPFMKEGGLGGNAYCINRAPQSGILVEDLMGMWYGVEVVQHLMGDARVDYGRTCIVIHIAEPRDRPSTEHQLYHVQAINAKFRAQHRHLRLLWDEAGQTVEYALYFRNDSAGYWRVYGGQNSTLPHRSYQNSYQQFDGTIQVLKAVNDHLLLNFCQESTEKGPAQQFSALFSRDPAVLAQWEISSIHALLQNKGLSVQSRRMVCGNSADKPMTSLLVSLTACILAFLVKS